MLKLLDQMTRDDFKSNPKTFHFIVQTIYDRNEVKRRGLVQFENDDIEACINDMQTETKLKKFFHLM